MKLVKRLCFLTAYKGENFSFERVPFCCCSFPGCALTCARSFPGSLLSGGLFPRFFSRNSLGNPSSGWRSQPRTNPAKSTTGLDWTNVVGGVSLLNRPLLKSSTIDHNAALLPYLLTRSNPSFLIAEPTTSA